MVTALSECDARNPVAVTRSTPRMSDPRWVEPVMPAWSVCLSSYFLLHEVMAFLIV